MSKIKFIPQEFKFHKPVRMKLGEAIQRLNMLHAKITNGVASPVEREEHKLILEGLNQQVIDVGFDCNLDGVPDTIEIFQASAQTSCCRAAKIGSSRRTRKAPPKKTTPRKTVVRKKPVRRKKS